MYIHSVSCLATQGYDCKNLLFGYLSMYIVYCRYRCYEVLYHYQAFFINFKLKYRINKFILLAVDEGNLKIY